MKASIALLACLFGIRTGWAPPIRANSRAVVDLDDRTLQEKYHIPPTTPGFLTALHHERSDVRSFAALRLAVEGQRDAIPAILAALSAETFPGAKISIATAAAELGGPRRYQRIGGYVPRSELVPYSKDGRSSKPSWERPSRRLSTCGLGHASVCPG